MEQVRVERELLIKAGVPHEYHDYALLIPEPDGAVGIYFGGVGRPDGPGHGHYVIDTHGDVCYRHDPFDPRDTQNSTDT